MPVARHAVRLRAAVEADMPFVLAGTSELAAVEGRPGDVTVTEAGLWRLLSAADVAAECVIIERGRGGGVGHAWFYVHASTFSGEAWLYLEDLVIRAEHRGAGLGRAAMGALARLAREKGCTGMHWTYVEGNAVAARFYAALGAVAKVGSRAMKITGEAFASLGRE